jgi:hypothetical protein
MRKELREQYDEICTVIDFAQGSRLHKQWVKKDILKTIRRTGVLDTTTLSPDFRWNLCAARLRSGRFDNWDGWEFRSNWAVTFQGLNCTDEQKIKIPKWFGQKTNHLVILGEQGIGDEIAHASAIPDLIVRVGHEAIEYQTYPRLKPIIERSFRIRCTDRRILSEVREGQYCVALADLFRFYRKDKSHFPRKPFLKPHPELKIQWQRNLQSLREKGKPLVGIAWKARHGVLDPLKLMDEDATYINLQYGNVELPPGVFDLEQDPTQDLEGHLALIANLDKVVTVTQTAVHAAGSIGVPCAAIMPPRGTGEVNNQLWYYGLGGPMILYKSVEVFPCLEDYLNRSRAL